MEMAVMCPSNRLSATITYRIKTIWLNQATDASAFNAMLDSVLHVVDSLYEAAPGKFFFLERKKPIPRLAEHVIWMVNTPFLWSHRRAGGYWQIAALPVHSNSCLRSDAKIVRIYVESK